MRKLSAGMAALVVFAICSSSYGYVVVYNMSIPVRGIDVNDDNSSVTIPLKAAMIMELSETPEGVLNIVDANLLIYGRKTDRDKAYVLLGTNDGNDFLGADMWEDGEYFVVHFWSDNCLFNFEANMRGREKPARQQSGTADNSNAAGNLKGDFLVWDKMLLSLSQNITGTGNISAILNVAQTRAFQEEDATLGAATNDLIEDFLGKFTKVNLPACGD